MTDLSTVSPPAWDLAAAADLCLAVQSIFLHSFSSMPSYYMTNFMTQNTC